MFTENLKIEWPEEDDDEEPPPKEAQSLVEKLLVQDPDMRLGSQALGGTCVCVCGVQCVAEFLQLAACQMVVFDVRSSGSASVC